MQRLAWISPVASDGAKTHPSSVDVLPLLGGDRAIDVFRADSPNGTLPTGDAPCPPGAAAVFAAPEFESRQAAAPYDLAVYELGASPRYDGVWPYLLRHPGLVVLRDDNLHAARARMLRAAGDGDALAAEFNRGHPGVPAGVVRLDTAGLLGGAARLWPMRRAALEAARAVLVHNAWLAAQLREEAPAVAVHVAPAGVPDVPAAAGARETVRQRYGVPDGAVLFAATGALSTAARLPHVLRALAALPDGGPAWRLLLCGEPDDDDGLRDAARTLGVEARLTATGPLADDELPAHLAAADVGVALQWPPSRGVAPAGLGWLAAGKPTIITDLAHTSDIPALDPRDWAIAGRPAARDAAGNPLEPAAVAIDILDEDHSLGLAVARLAADPMLRAELGRAARHLWETQFTLEHMAAGYRQAIDDACRAGSAIVG